MKQIYTTLVLIALSVTAYSQTFYISKTNNNVQLTWSTDQELNRSHYEIERSFDGREWKSIALIFSAENGTVVNSYRYEDKNVSNEVFHYRLRLVDMDGRFTYSSVKTIRSTETVSAVKIYGSEKKVIIDLNASPQSDILVSVINNSGQVITQKSYRNPSTKINVDLGSIASGTYVVQVTDKKGLSEVKKVVL